MKTSKTIPGSCCSLCQAGPLRIEKVPRHGTVVHFAGALVFALGLSFLAFAAMPWLGPDRARGREVETLAQATIGLIFWASLCLGLGAVTISSRRVLGCRACGSLFPTSA